MVDFAVIDVETTGLKSSDRVIEIAVVKLDENRNVTDKWSSLVNPEREVSSTHINGITQSMVSSAPKFIDLLDHLRDLVSGAVLVAHNLPFDQGMISGELTREQLYWSPGRGIDTLVLTGNKSLPIACASHGIQLTQVHRALSDAEATAQLFSAIYDSTLLDWTEAAFVPVYLRI